jgi:hypothetical protein
MPEPEIYRTYSNYNDLRYGAPSQSDDRPAVGEATVRVTHICYGGDVPEQRATYSPQAVRVKSSRKPRLLGLVGEPRGSKKDEKK